MDTTHSNNHTDTCSSGENETASPFRASFPSRLAKDDEAAGGNEDFDDDDAVGSEVGDEVALSSKDVCLLLPFLPGELFSQVLLPIPRNSQLSTGPTASCRGV